MSEIMTTNELVKYFGVKWNFKVKSYDGYKGLDEKKAD